MKGVEFISDIFLLIVLLAIVVIMTLFINALIITFQVENKLTNGGMLTTRNVELKLFIKPVNYDALMSAFLEYEDNGIKVRRILNAAAIQGSANVWLDGKRIDVSDMSETFLTPYIEPKDYLLKLGDITIVKHGDFSSQGIPLGLEKISTYAFLLDGKEAYLQLFVAD